MMHQPSGGGRGTAADIEIVAREILHTRRTMNQLMARHTGQPVERIERDFDRDRYMSADEARAYGLVDHVVVRPGELVEPSAQEALTG
jgi:ATP-dependent Clp protease protease subunit